MPQKNQIVELIISDMTHEGSGIGHLDGMAVFVPGSAVGDRLRVRLVKVNKTHCYGRIEQVATPSSDRIKPDCPVSQRCGGCVFRHISYAAELRHKQAFVQSNLQRIGGISIDLEPIEASPLESGYRNKAQYPVRMQKGRLAAGFFAPRTHEVVDCHHCKLQPAFFGELLEALLGYLTEFRVPVYDETTGKGLFRHLYLRYGQRTEEVMVCLVVNGRALPEEQTLVQILLKVCPQVVSVVLNTNDRNTNVILGPYTRTLYGKPQISDLLCGVRFDLSPHAFYQVNALGAERLYQIAAEYAGLTGRETVLDFYCGAGTIGLSMAHLCREVIGVEIVPQAVENARENARKNEIDTARFICADASDAALRLNQEGIRPDVVLLDPPRKGCAQDVLHTVAEMCPERIVYISCNSATLSRDLALLETLGYQTVRGRPVDLFPRTNHVETVILMSKVNPQQHKKH